MLGIAGLATTPIVLSEEFCTTEGANQYCDARIPSSSFTHIRSLNDQRQMYWCWAATLAMIFKWHGREISQENIVTQTFGSVINAPASPLVLINSVNRRYIDNHGREFSVESRSWGPEFGINQIDNNVIVQSLASENPMVVCNRTHMMVLTGVGYLRTLNGLRVMEAWVADPFLIGKVAHDLPSGFRYLPLPDMFPTSLGGNLRYVADVSVN